MAAAVAKRPPNSRKAGFRSHIPLFSRHTSRSKTSSEYIYRSSAAESVVAELFATTLLAFV